jgi:hypothetical protein
MTRNEAERLEMISLYVKHVKSLPDKEWSRQQNVVIDSIYTSAIQVDPKVYLKLKGEPCDRE